MMRLLVFIYGLFSYIVGLGGLTWFILFIGGWEFLPRHIDSEIAGPLGSALVINMALILAFGLQHSIMARPSFKSQLTKVLTPAAERSTYVLLSGIIMAAICLYWQPINGTIWAISNPILHKLLITAYIFGWVFAVIATFLINHFELFGLQQIYCNLVNKPEPSETFTDRWFYKIVRHPLQLGVLIGMWSAPVMSITHFMLALTMSVYIFIGLYFEEKDLVAILGKDYENYQKRVPKIIPIPKR